MALDDDVLRAIEEESRSRGVSFQKTLNDLLRSGLQLERRHQEQRPKFKVEPFDMGFRPDLNYDDIGGVIQYLEGPYYR